MPQNLSVRLKTVNTKFKKKGSCEAGYTAAQLNSAQGHGKSVVKRAALL